MKAFSLSAVVSATILATLGLCQPAKAGHWEGPVYSNSSDSQNYCVSVSSPYQHWDGGSAHNVSGQVRNGYGPGYVTCKGTIGATWTWIPDYDQYGNPDDPFTGHTPGHYKTHCNAYGDLTLDSNTVSDNNASYTISVRGVSYAGAFSTAMDNHQIWDNLGQPVQVTVNIDGEKDTVWQVGDSCVFDIESNQRIANELGFWADWDGTASCSFNAALSWVDDPQ